MVAASSVEFLVYDEMGYTMLLVFIDHVTHPSLHRVLRRASSCIVTIVVSSTKCHILCRKGISSRDQTSLRSMWLALRKGNCKLRCQTYMNPAVMGAPGPDSSDPRSGNLEILRLRRNSEKAH